MNYTERYTRTAIAIHWLAAILIIGNLLWGLYMVSLDLSPTKLKYYSWHKWTGVTVFVLAAFRLLWRLRHPAPALPASMPAWQRSAAHASHVLLYVLFFAGPLSGWLFSSAAGFQTVWFGVLPIPDLIGKNKELADVLKLVHRSVVYALGGVIALHAAAAIKHHVLDRDDVLTRMMPFLRPRPPAPPSPLPPART
jgi:cytochrome b561